MSQPHSLRIGERDPKEWESKPYWCVNCQQKFESPTMASKTKCIDEMPHWSQEEKKNENP